MKILGTTSSFCFQALAVKEQSEMHTRRGPRPVISKLRNPAKEIPIEGTHIHIEEHFHQTNSHHTYSHPCSGTPTRLARQTPQGRLEWTCAHAAKQHAWVGCAHGAKHAWEAVHARLYACKSSCALRGAYFADALSQCSVQPQPQAPHLNALRSHSQGQETQADERLWAGTWAPLHACAYASIPFLGLSELHRHPLLGGTVGVA